MTEVQNSATASCHLPVLRRMVKPSSAHPYADGEAECPGMISSAIQARDGALYRAGLPMSVHIFQSLDFGFSHKVI